MREPRQLTVGSLFSGIGGFDLGLERAGMRVIWQSEIDPYASAVLRRHWPTVPNLGDIRGISAATLADAGHDQSQERASDDGIDEQRAAQRRWSEQSAGIGASGRDRLGSIATRASIMGSVTAQHSRFPDILCGGFPCQDISNAGKRAGIDGERSGLWSEFARLIGELRPRYVIVENVAALLGRGIERVLGDLAALGFDAEWHCIPASAVGAPHRRDRVWIVAGRGDIFPHAEQFGRNEWGQQQSCGTGETTGNLADADGSNRHWGRRALQMGWGWRAREIADDGRFGNAQWRVEPDVGRVAHGIPRRVDRLRCLGNAIVPQIAEIIARAIVESEG